MAVYVVGDIQGCLSGLESLLEKIGFSRSNDRLIAVGDLVGRGPQALETLHFLHSLGDSFDTVLGNHDLHLLAIYAGIRKAKPSDKLDALLSSPKIKTYIKWLRKKPLALLLDENTLVTHAGLYPKWSTKKALTYSAEVSEQLSSKNWTLFLNYMYGNLPSVWNKTLQGEERLRFIVNALTRMRFIQHQDQLEFTCKVKPEEAPKELTPWFNIHNEKFKSSERIVFGHWASLNGKTDSEQIIGLDTGYVWGQKMTVLNIENNKIYSVKFQE